MMPGKIKVKVLAGRNLPVMDRASDTTDAFVEIKFGGVTHKTDVCRKSLNPHWNSTEWYRFEVDESELQDEPLQLRLMDHDTYSANDAIGKVVISLAPMLCREPAPSTKGTAAPQSGAVMSGWIPVFDTMHGIRGELNVIVKVELFSDFNKYKTSSCGVQFFHCPIIPPGYRATAIHGFVEELVVNDDPEYQWIDKIRTPRASNEARQVAFIKLSNQVQRLVGLKASELGANAVVGYQQAFDLEGESGVVARAIGTAISIVPLPTPSQPSAPPVWTQQQLKKYLDILSTDGESIVDLNQYLQSHQDELQKLLGILHPKLSSNFLDVQDNDNDDDDKVVDLTVQCSVKSYADSVSIFQEDHISHQSLRHIVEDQTDLNKFLYPDESEQEEEAPSPLKKIKKIKPNFFTKRFGNFRSKKAEKMADDQVSMKSTSSDASRISLCELRNEFKKLKRLKKPKLRHPVSNNDEGIGMASILARSVIHARTSLACIAETQDSEHSPCSTLRRTSESEPTMNISDEDRVKLKDPNQLETGKTDNENKISLPEIHFSSLKDINVEESMHLHRKLSESCPNTPMTSRTNNFLKLPNDIGYFGSISSALSADSSEMYTTTDEDDESSDVKTDTEISVETTTSLIRIVLKEEVNPMFTSPIETKINQPQFNEVLPLTGSGSKSLNIKQQNVTIKKHMSDGNLGGVYDDLKGHEKEHSKIADRKNSVPSHHHFKFHNPFSHKKSTKSLSEPSSPVEKKPNIVYRSSRRLKRQISKLSKSSMIQSLSHYSVIPKSKNISTKASSDHSSGSDVLSKTHSRETVLGSPFLSYSDLLVFDKEVLDLAHQQHKEYVPEQNKKVHMYIGSEPVSRTSVSGPASPKILDHTDDAKSHKRDKHNAIKATGLLHTAMETILIDKVQSLLIPTSPEPAVTSEKEKRFFDDVTEKLEKVEEMQHMARNVNDEKVEASTGNLQKKLVRQDSVHSLKEHIAGDPSSNEMSKETNANDHSPIKHYRTKSKPVLQHLHPIMSGPVHPRLFHLDTIPSLPESFSIDLECSLDKTESIDSDLDIVVENRIPIPTLEIDPAEDLDESVKVEIDLADQTVRIPETNIAIPVEDSVVCDNSHAACRGPVHREREKEKEKERGSPKHSRHESYGGRDPVTTLAVTTQQNSSLNASSTPVGIHRRSSDSDLSVTPKGSSLNASGGNTVTTGGGAILKPSMNSNNIDMLEYPFLTMTEYPSGFIVHIGGTVCARSVKLVDGGGEAASRAAWWAELRTELRAHARALRCNAVLAYTETAAICEDVCVLSASGTAAIINLDCDFDADLENVAGVAKASEEDASDIDTCAGAHVPYSASGGPYRAELLLCALCRRARVPGVLLATCARPRRLLAHARHNTLTAVAARVRRAPPQSEPGARDISDQLPFLEYELHKLLLAKLRMQGANAVFNLQTQIAIGERCVVALASGTAVRLAALPPPAPPRIKTAENDKEALELQKALWDTFTLNKAANGYDVSLPELVNNGILPEVDNDETPSLDLCSDKDACVLELDEAEEIETARSLCIRRSYLPVLTSHLHPLPKAKPYAFTQVWRGRFNGGTMSAEKHVARALEGVHYKLRTLTPCALTPTRFQIELAEDEIQLVTCGAAIPLVDPNRPEHHVNGTDDAAHCKNGPMQASMSGASSNQAMYNSQGASQGPYSHGLGTGDADDDIFTLDEEQGTPPKPTPAEAEDKNVIPNGQVPSSVALTPLSVLSGARLQRRVCALRLLFVRETTSVRELGGLSGFLHTTMCEVLAIVRAYTAALGGNALTSFYFTQLMLQDNAHKNQGQCLLSVGGDVVHITY